MKFSEAAAKEMRELAQSSAFKEDLETVVRKRHNPFVKSGKVDVDAYISFVTQFNEFINHEPKRFKAIIDKDMRL